MTNIKIQYIYNDSWWDFCLDTWNPNTDQYDYSLEDKSDETKQYLTMLRESSIELGFSGSCKCLNWDKFLSIVLTCLLSHKAPYSPIFYNKIHNFFFYFHHSQSIGFYFKDDSNTIVSILNRARIFYKLEESR